MTQDKRDRPEVVRVPQKKHVLADLIAQCDPRAPLPTDLALWDAAKPSGEEAWQMPGRRLRSAPN